ncbi:MAG: hypothetical protein ACE37H_00990 [Phycisphaeraceae bacterium]
MQRLLWTTRKPLICAALAGLLAVVGCGSAPQGSRQPAIHQPPQRSVDAAQGPRTLGATPEIDQPTPAEMQRLIARLDMLETDNAQLKKQLSDQYMEAIRQRREQLAKEEAAGATNKAQPNNASQNAGAGTDNTSAPAPPAGLDAAPRQALMDELVRRIVNGQDPARTKALMVAAISVANQKHDLDHDLLDGLDPRSREQIARFHQMLAVAFDELAGEPSRTLTRREMVAKIDEVFGAQPLKIETLELCRRVDSYGVYEPFAAPRFLSGRKNRILVYVELENFHHEPTEDGRFEVKLEQSVELYDATGEATVWRQGPVELVDVSRNKRRDFFIVYPIDLPARLTAGSYRLKVRVADKHTGSICEQTLHDIKIVADRALVGGN